jgi:hypothetical protein
METLRRTPRTTILGVTIALLWISMAFGYWLNVGDEDSQVVAYLVVCAIGSAIAAYLLLRFVPATESEADGNAPARRSLVLGVVAALTFVVFWTGLPIILGIPALVLGAEGHARSGTHDGGAEAIAGMIFGGLAALGAIVLLVSGA